MANLVSQCVLADYQVAAKTIPATERIGVVGCRYQPVRPGETGKIRPRKNG